VQNYDLFGNYSNASEPHSIDKQSE